MKASIEWEEEDLLNLVRIRARESRNLEFKSCRALARDKTIEIAKDVSAFANASGGSIVYGIIENKDTHEAEHLDGGYDPREISELWLEQVIDSNIQQRLEGVVIRPIDLVKTAPARVAYVVWIPASNRAPHMVNHIYYKRQNFRVVEMEEDEVRERYRRESFPGKDVVEAWRDDVINPLITSLQNESATLEAERWNWNHFYNKFGGLSDIGNQNEFSANKEDFVERHPQIGESLSQHDLLLETLNVAGKELFEKVSNSSFIRDIFTSTTSEESLEALLAANPHTFSGTTAADVVRELFGNDQNEQDRYDIFTEWTINGHWPPNLTRSYVAFWEAYRDRFHALISYPPLNEYRRKVQDIRRELREVNLRIMSMLKLIRKELSERHRIPVEASRSGGQYFFDDFGYPRNRLV